MWTVQGMVTGSVTNHQNPPRPLASRRVDPGLWILPSWTPLASWILLLLYSKNRKPSPPSPLPGLGSLPRKLSRHPCRPLIATQFRQFPCLCSASLPCLPHRFHERNPTIYWAPPATTEHTKPQPDTTRIQQFASTGNQESNAPMNSKAPLESSGLPNPASDHGAHQTATRHH